MKKPDEIRRPNVASIESLGTPIVFKARIPGAAEADSGDGNRVRLRSEVRTLEGMQKEALVYDGPSGSIWRMVSDEGPYLQGSDLAPFPLAFYTAGVVFSFMTEMLKHATTLGIEIDSLGMTSDHYYTMNGSALRGDMIGGALPIELAVELGTEVKHETFDRLIEMTKASSPAESYMRVSLQNRFSLTANGRQIELEDLSPCDPDAEDPEPRFDHIETLPGSFLPDLVTKLAAAEVVHGVEGGAGSSLQAVQKRTLHVRGEARLLTATLKEIRVHLLQPIGSSFRFLSDDGGNDQAPPALAYLSAGIGFCYMTQMGRYARITRKDLKSYRIVQDNVFELAGSASSESRTTLARPVETHLFLTLDEADEVARRIAFMSEQTCFLHAAMRGSHPTRTRLAR